MFLYHLFTLISIYLLKFWVSPIEKNKLGRVIISCFLRALSYLLRLIILNFAYMAHYMITDYVFFLPSNVIDHA